MNNLLRVLQESLRPTCLSMPFPIQSLNPNARSSTSAEILWNSSSRSAISPSKFGEEDSHAGPLELDGALDMFCDGVHSFGPFSEHMIGYWDAHLKNPDKVLFLKYEDLKDDIALHVRKIAEFMGCPFSLEDEGRDLVEKISRVCSFDNLKNLEVNNNGYSVNGIVKNSSFFRKGEVGDWSNHLTPAMAERMEKVIKSKLQGSGSTLHINT